MEKFEFKSQICTDINQSRKLLELGLKKETADMMYITSEVDGLGKPLPEEYRYYRLEIGDYHKPIGKGMLHIPAWSLHRLMQLIDWNYNFWSLDEVYNIIIYLIEDRISSGDINKDYLEEKK